jgi:hypothetical protein
MSFERCRWALACFFTSALIAHGASAEISAHRARAAELEAELAARRDVYLVVGVESGVLEIRVRGVTLERIPVATVHAFERRRLVDGEGASQLEVPHLFVTAATINLVERRVVAPETLQPWSEGAESTLRASGEDPKPQAPSSYDVPLEGGWILEVRQERVDLSTSGKLLEAFRDLWLRAAGARDRDRRPTVQLVLDDASAKRLHHLFVKGAAILLVPDMSYRTSR